MNKMCKFCKDDFCENEKCPMMAEYCPVTHRPDICKYAELVDAVMSPKECLLATLNDNGFGVKDNEMSRVWDDFVELMAENGHIITGVDSLKFKVINPEDSENYVSNKEEDIEFVMNEYVATSLFIEFVKKIDSKTWLVGVEDTVVQVEFDLSWDEYVYTIDGSGPRSHDSYEHIAKDIYDYVMSKRGSNDDCAGNPAVSVGDVVCIDDIEKSKDWKLKSFASNPFDTSCTYVSTDGMFIVRFEHEKKHGAVVLNRA